MLIFLSLSYFNYITLFLKKRVKFFETNNAEDYSL